MNEPFLLLPIWLILVIWGLVYVSDYALTIYSARLFRGRLSEHIRFEGSFELTPAFQKDVDALRVFSPNFVLRLLASFPLIYLVFWLATFIGLPQLFAFLMGGLLLREAAVHLRHLRNLSLDLCTRQGGGLRGTIEYAHWLSQRLSALEFAGFGVLLLLLAALQGSWFFTGGGVVLLFTAAQHWRYAKQRQARSAAPAQ